MSSPTPFFVVVRFFTFHDKTFNNDEKKNIFPIAEPR